MDKDQTSTSENESGLPEKEEHLSVDGSMRRRLLKMLLALGIATPLSIHTESKEKARSILPDNLEINSAADLEQLLEAILPAVHEDFAAQDRATEKLQQQTGNHKAKAAPLNGETFLASVEDFAQRIERMIHPRGVMEKMDRTMDERLTKAGERYRANPASKDAVQEWVRAMQLVDLFAAKPVTNQLSDFWQRVDTFNATIGKKLNRVPATSKQQDARTENRKVVKYLSKIIKGHEAVQEYIRNFHAKNPIVYGERAWRFSADVSEPFLFDRSGGYMVSLGES